MKTYLGNDIKEINTDYWVKSHNCFVIFGLCIINKASETKIAAAF